MLEKSKQSPTRNLMTVDGLGRISGGFTLFHLFQNVTTDKFGDFSLFLNFVMLRYKYDIKDKYLIKSKKSK